MHKTNSHEPLQLPDTLIETDRPAGGNRDDDPRLGSMICFDYREVAEPVLAIVGFPVDEGVRRNGGRPGAAASPAHIRSALYQMTPDATASKQFDWVARRTVDVGDVDSDGDLAELQHRLGEVVASLLNSGVTPIVIGGGHESSFGHFLGYALRRQNVEIVNLDAHLDVRPLVAEGGHSGSPFRQAIEHESRSCASYTVAGAQPGRNARAHVDYLSQRGGKIVWAEDLAKIGSLEGLFVPKRPDSGIMLTIDMDVVDAAFAPGVSAPTIGGVSPDFVRMAALMAGSLTSVTSIDVVELNSRLDVDGRTARLAALLVWSFMKGFARRINA